MCLCAFVSIYNCLNVNNRDLQEIYFAIAVNLTLYITEQIIIREQFCGLRQYFDASAYLLLLKNVDTYMKHSFVCLRAVGYG